MKEAHLRLKIKQNFGIYEERARRHPELAQPPDLGPNVPHILTASTSQDFVGVTARLLSVYDGSHGICRNADLYEATMWQLLAGRCDEEV